MTREEAKDLFRKDVDAYGKPKKIMTKIDMIFDDFEKEKAMKKNTYGTDKSWMLNELIKAGHKPLAITVMACEETFVFETEAEIEKARKGWGNEGWWYTKEEFPATREWYVKEFYKGVEKDAPKVYWLNKNDNNQRAK